MSSEDEELSGTNQTANVR